MKLSGLFEGVVSHDRVDRAIFTDERGQLVAHEARIARIGVQNYFAVELGLDKLVEGVEPTDIIRLYRPPEQVFKQESLDSFRFLPLTLEHPLDPLVTEENWESVVVGRVSDTKPDGRFLLATVVVQSPDAQAAVRAGKIGLSAGYAFDLDFTSGITPDGEAYDGIQTNIYGNHVALVSKARCGTACRIGDTEHIHNGGGTMAEKKIVVGGITIEVSEMAASVIENGIKVADAALAKVTGELMESQKALTAKDAELAEAKKAVPTPEAIEALVKDRLQTISVAQKVAPSVAVDGLTSEQIHRAVLVDVTGKDAGLNDIAHAIVGSDQYATADAEKVKLAFVAIGAAKGKTVNAGDAAVAAALAAKSAGGEKTEKPVGRAAMMKGMQTGFAK